jgi:hypothetical protein
VGCRRDVFRLQRITAGDDPRDRLQRGGLRRW